jgi:hypothetical protein
LNGGGNGLSKAVLEARTWPVFGRKSFEGVEPAKYELLTITGSLDLIVTLGLRRDRKGAGSDRICRLVGRRRALACGIACCGGLGWEDIDKGSEGMRGR